MKEDTKETAVELLSEWKLLEDHVISVRRDEISRRLDEMCEAAGISIIQGHFVYAKCVRGDAAFGGWFGAVIPENWARIPAREQQALQEWLLIKEGGNNVN